MWIMREQSYGVMAKPLSRALAEEWKDNNAASSGSTGVVGQRGLLLLAWCLLLCNIGRRARGRQRAGGPQLDS